MGGVPAKITVLTLAFLLALWKIPEQQVKDLLPSEKRVELENSSRATLAQTLGGAILLAGLYFTWRNLQVTEEKQITERFTKAIELLGSKEKDIRLGAIYALERIAKDSPKDHSTIMEILTSYVRDKSSPFSKNTRSKIVKTILPDYKYDTEIQAILTVLGRRNIPKGIEEQILNLQSANLSGFTFPPNSNFANTNFKKANLSKATLKEAVFTSADFREANLSEATLKEAIFTNADFSDANFESADLGSADFRKAKLRYANLNSAKLNSTQLEAAKLENAFLYDADLSESSLKSANLSKAHLRGARFNKVDFSKATLTDADFNDFLIWGRRHWSQEELEYQALQEEQDPDDYDPYDEDDYHRTPQYCVDFRQSSLTSSQVKVAINIEDAVYDDAIEKELELPIRKLTVREL